LKSLTREHKEEILKVILGNPNKEIPFGLRGGGLFPLDGSGDDIIYHDNSNLRTLIKHNDGLKQGQQYIKEILGFIEKLKKRRWELEFEKYRDLLD